MTRLDFIALCGQLLLDPDLVIADPVVIDLLKRRQDAKLKEYLEHAY